MRLYRFEQLNCPQFPQFPQVFPPVGRQLGRGHWGFFPQFPSSPVVYRGINWGDEESMTYARFAFSPVIPPVSEAR